MKMASVIFCLKNHRDQSVYARTPGFIYELNVHNCKCDSSRLFPPFRPGGDLLDAPPRRREDEVRRVKNASRLQELPGLPGFVRPH